MKKGMFLAMRSFALYLIVKFNYNLITISDNNCFLNLMKSSFFATHNFTT